MATEVSLRVLERRFGGVSRFPVQERAQPGSVHAHHIPCPIHGSLTWVHFRQINCVRERTDIDGMLCFLEQQSSGVSNATPLKNKPLAVYNNEYHHEASMIIHTKYHSCSLFSSACTRVTLKVWGSPPKILRQVVGIKHCHALDSH